MKNQFVADVLYQIADLLDIKGEIFFKTRAYRMAAQKIETLDEDIEVVVKENRLKDIPGVGEGLAKKIKELIETGKLEYLEKLKKEIPPELLKMLDISGFGPRKIAAVYRKLGIKTIDELREAAERGKLRDLEGFGEITEKNILRGIQLMDKTSGRVLLNVAYYHGNKYIEYLKKHKKINRLSIAGSLRRMKETIGDIDILASSDEPDEIMDYFVKYPDVQRILMKGSTKSSVILKDELQVDLRVVENKSFGAALQYFTGSKEHNVKMRSLAIKKGFKLSEYGLFKKNTDRFIVGENESDIYKKLGLMFIEPELRENRGEIEAAEKNKLPDLVKYNDIKGDLHVHSNYSDGFETIEAIFEKSRELGYQYVGITDHSQSLRVAHGLIKEQIVKKKKEIEKINKKLDNFRILCGTECDIKPDGTLDYNNSILKMFDFVVIGVHTGFKMSRNEATNRIIKGMENEYANILAHPTCRLMMKREPLDLDMEKIFEAARETNTYLEINAFPDRLDLNDYHTKLAKELKAKFVVGTDAHALNHMDFMKYGVATARRGWLEKKDILNTYTLKEIEKIFEL